MAVTKLFIENYRNLKPQTLTFSNGFNVIISKNAQGKTNLIEALYFLAHNKSFKTRHIENIINQGEQQLSISAIVARPTANHQIKIYRNHRKSEIYIDNNIIKNTASLTQLMPIQLISADSGFIVTAPPKIKRQRLDWGVFHVKQDAYQLFSKHKQLMLHINHLLLTGQKKATLPVWLESLAETTVEINQLRTNHINTLQKILNKNKRQATVLNNFCFQLNLGFPKGVNALSRETVQQFFTEQTHYFLKKGYMPYGCHRATINFSVNNTPIDLFSRGEQKVYSIIFYLLQVFYLKQENIQPIVLIDDVSSELDSRKTRVLLNFLTKLDCQVFLTNITPLPTFNRPDTIKAFTISQGAITEHTKTN